MAEDGTFNETTGSTFVNGYDTVRGYVRERLVQQRLSPYLPAAPCEIIDIGGGDGRDACWLASLGHRVVLIDSQDMVDKAQVTIRNNSEAVQQNVTCVVGTDKTAFEQYGPSKFDVLVSHGVLMYELAAPEKQLERCMQLIKPSGLMSLLTKGKSGATARFIQDAEVVAAAESFKTGRCVNKLGVSVQAYSEDELIDLINQYGGAVKEWFGLHVTTDPMRQPASDFSKEELAEILTLEAALGAQESVRGIGQMLHFLVQKHL